MKINNINFVYIKSKFHNQILNSIINTIEYQYYFIILYIIILFYSNQLYHFINILYIK